MKKNWFKNWGWIYRPTSWQGWVYTLLFIGFCVKVFLVIDSQSHSVSDTLYGIFPFVVPAFLLWLWLAERSSER